MAHNASRESITETIGDNMNFTSYQKNASKTSGQSGQTARRLMVATLGLAGESGEVADLVKKHIGHGHELDLYALEKELGDVLWYVAEICTALDLELSEVARANISKLKARYPEGFTTDRSINR